MLISVSIQSMVFHIMCSHEHKRTFPRQLYMVWVNILVFNYTMRNTLSLFQLYTLHFIWTESTLNRHFVFMSNRWDYLYL